MRNGALTLVFLIFSYVLNAQEYGFDCFMLEDGLPRAHVTTIQEDLDGFLLIGTKSGGLARFDGHRFSVLDRSKGLSSNDVRCSYTDTSEHHAPIWIGCGDRIDRFFHGNIVPFPYEFPATVSTMTQDAEGRMWVGTLGAGAFCIRGDKLLARPEEMPFKVVNSLLYNEVLYAGTDTGLFVLEDAVWQRIPITLPSQKVRSMAQGVKGLYLATDKGLALIRKDGEQWHSTVINLPAKGLTPQCIFIDNVDRLWVGTSNGAYKIEPNGSIVHFNEESGLSNSDIKTIYQDRSGAVWLGSAYGGICKFTSEAFVHYSSRSGLGENIVSGTLRDRRGDLWISTFGGGISHVRRGTKKRFSQLNGMPSDHVHGLCEHPENGVFAATERGPVLIQDGKVKTFDDLKAPCSSIVVDADRKLWVASESGWQKLSEKNGDWLLESVLAQHLGYVSDMDTLGEALYASTDKGVYVIDIRSEEISKIERSGMPNDRFTSIALGGNGEIWVGTAESGLVRIMSDTVEVYTMEAGLSADQIELVMLDAYENVWVGTKRGIDMIELDVLQEYVLNIDNYTTADGFIGMEVFRNAGMLDDDGTLWFGTTMGATKYDPEKILYDNTEPKTRITNVLLNYEDVDWSKWASETETVHDLPAGLDLPYNKNHLTFEFAGISLAYPERVRYQYFLEGFEEEWSPITATDRVTYPSIPPGDYAFKVISRNASGIWNQEPEIFKFSVRAPLWQNKWFLGGLALFLILLFYSIVKLRERSFKRERVRLEAMVNERTNALAKSKQRSEDLLLNILPGPIAKELRDHGKAKAREYEECSVLFSDFKDFTTFSAKMDGDDLVEELDMIFRSFDAINERYNIEKIKTIGDAYMCASGLPEENKDHALNSVLMGLEMIKALNVINRKYAAEGKQQWLVRVGVHTGPLVAGVVGEKKFAYDIWGDTVNTASRMEHASEAGRLNISGVTYSHVMDYIDATVRGPLKVKGKGELMMYFVDRIKPEFSADKEGMTPNEKLLRILDEDRVS